MSFTSVAFLVFAALTLLVYYTVPKRGQWIVLLVASSLFYWAAGSWYLPFIMATILSTWLCALGIRHRDRLDAAYLAEHKADMTKEERKAFKANAKKKKRPYLLGGLIFNFAILGVLKYTGFVLGGVNDLLALFATDEVSLSVSVPTLILPLGISYYIFRSTAYLIDVYWGKTEAEGNIAKYALFVSFFPAVLQGPISRHKDLAPQFFTPHRAEWYNLSEGGLRVLWGFFKKVVIADTAMIAVKSIIEYPEEFTGMYVLLLIILYSAVIYGDFTGGIDITIGLSRMMGLKLAENFDHPFSSRSTQEYWNRWHMTMGSYFTDYVFNPLSISGPMKKLSKWSREKLGKTVGMRVPVYLATLITWFLTGLWHGAAWNFIVWGLLNGVVILVSREFSPLYAKFHQKFPTLKEKTFYGGFCAVRTFFLMGAIRILDCYRDVPLTFKAFGSMFYDFASWRDLADGKIWNMLGLELWQYIVIILAVTVVFFVSHRSKTKPVLTEVSEQPWLYGFVCALLILVILIFGSYGIGFDAGDFIYQTQF
ncbi:MAG: MBOAT family protein [Ruminococcaceae bacterium]|nr:MBOAT family protein [Oscillospiraceae bacterium]